jgi:CDP-diacylglycerol--glycerol-3-phosphate 3-phosphatidyltransferase/cardiolipin synthase
MTPPPRAPENTFFTREEVLLLPNLLTALRVPLALAFPFVARSRPKALLVVGLAGLTDVLDGWVARRTGQMTSTGAALDPIADKVFALSVVGTLIAHGKLPRWGIPALLAREILEGPLLLWVFHEARMGTPPSVGDMRATTAGKVATSAQFAAIYAALALPAVLPLALVVAAATGTVAGAEYWRRELARRTP